MYKEYPKIKFDGQNFHKNIRTSQKMTSTVVTPSSFNSKNISITVPKQIPNGSKQAYMNYDSQKFVMQTAVSMSVPFGLNVADKFGPPEYSVEISFRGNEQRPEIKEFMDVIAQIDEKLLEEGVKNSKAWFKADLSRDVVKAFYTPSLKYSKDKEGNVLTYPPNLKLKLRKLNGDFETKFYDINGNPYKNIPIEELLVKGVQVTAIIECGGVWFAGSKFGITWRAKQIAVHKLPEKIADFAFKGLGSSQVDDDDAFRKPSVLDSVMPEAVSESVASESVDEEGDDVEPAPVPKKTIIKKKIVTAKK